MSDISFTVNEDIVLIISYATPVTVTLNYEYYNSDGEYERTDTVVYNMYKGQYLNNDFVSNWEYVCYDAYRLGYKGLRYENVVNEDLELTVRYVKLQEAVGVWDYLHDKTGLFSEKVYRIIDCDSTTGTCTISAESFVGYNQVNDTATFFELSTTDGNTINLFADVYNNELPSEVILSESKEVNPNISYLKAELQPTDISQFIPIDNNGGVSNGGTSLVDSQYEMYYKAMMPKVTLKVVDEYLDENSSV